MSTRARVALAVAVAAGLASWAALTNPFSASADTVTAIALALVLCVAVVRWRVPATVGPADPTLGPRSRWWPWLAFGVTVVAWEVVSFALTPRVDHPTLSSLYDSAAADRDVKALLFLAWMSLGALLVRR